jgi:hypothetical protein
MHFSGFIISLIVKNIFSIHEGFSKVYYMNSIPNSNLKMPIKKRYRALIEILFFFVIDKMEPLLY